MAFYAAGHSEAIRPGRRRLDEHPDRERIESLDRDLLPEWGSYGCAADYVTIVEAQLDADLDLLLSYAALREGCRLDDIKVAVKAMRRAGIVHAADKLTAASVRALTDLGLGHNNDDRLTSEIGYPNVKRIQEMLVTHPEDALLIKAALDRRVYDPEGIRGLVESIRPIEAAVMDGAL